MSMVKKGNTPVKTEKEYQEKTTTDINKLFFQYTGSRLILLISIKYTFLIFYMPPDQNVFKK
jgi:hypothetical protein